MNEHNALDATNEFYGTIKIFAGDFAPKGTALCQGQVIPIPSNTGLFAVLGTYYGGDGMTTFALPDLRGRTPMHWGTGAGLPDYSIGEQPGVENITLLQTNLPVHNHQLTLQGANNTTGTTSDPEGNYPAATGTENDYGTSNGNMLAYQHNLTVASSGGGQSFSIRQPYLVVNFIIFLSGVFPARN